KPNGGKLCESLCKRGVDDALGMELLFDVGVHAHLLHPLDIVWPRAKAEPVQHVHHRVSVGLTGSLARQWGGETKPDRQNGDQAPRDDVQRFHDQLDLRGTSIVKDGGWRMEDGGLRMERIDGTALEQVLDENWPIWGDGLTRNAYGQWILAQARTAWGRYSLLRVGLFVAGEVVASAKRYLFDAVLDGQSVRVLGIGAVFTSEAQRGRGLA